MEADAPPSDEIRFVLDDRPVTLRRPAPLRTLLEYLREDEGLTGTKEGCAEGDCGACTVVIGRRCGERNEWRAVNSCIRLLPTIDGCEVVTVEALSAPSVEQSAQLHPVQRAMVEQHASQCGFCTPGFVMSLFALYLGRSHASREDVVDALAGNLCRCTGYRPIIDAGLAMFGLPETARWSRAAAHGEAAVARLASLERPADAAVDYAGFSAPRTLDALVRQLDATPDATILAGGTDIGLWITKQLRVLPQVIYLGDIDALRQVSVTDDGLWIGAAVTLTDAWPQLVQRWPGLAEQAARFASPPVRNSATLCGNLANGSPIGDSLPVMLALGAELDLRSVRGTRRVPLEEFYLGYRRTALERGEVVAGVFVPTAVGGAVHASYKLGKRIDQDISAVSAAFHIEISRGIVARARLAFGGLDAIARRSAAAETELVGNPFDGASVARACTALQADFSPIGDHRASASYRLRGATALLRRFLAEHGSDQVLHVTAEPPELA